MNWVIGDWQFSPPPQTLTHGSFLKPDWLNAPLATLSSWSLLVNLKQLKVRRPRKHHISFSFLKSNPDPSPPAQTRSYRHPSSLRAVVRLFPNTVNISFRTSVWRRMCLIIPESNTLIAVSIFIVLMLSKDWTESTQNLEKTVRFYDAFNLNWIRIGLSSYTPADGTNCGNTDWNSCRKPRYMNSRGLEMTFCLKKITTHNHILKMIYYIREGRDPFCAWSKPDTLQCVYTGGV